MTEPVPELPAPFEPEPGSPLAQRLAERRRRLAAGGAPPAPAERDAEALAAFRIAVDTLHDLLAEEIGALQARDFDRVERLCPRKAEAVQALERLGPMVEPFLDHALTEDPALHETMERLAELVRTDLTLLDRVVEATGRIAREHARILDRHSLKGLYEKSGRKVGASRAPARTIDESH